MSIDNPFDDLDRFDEVFGDLEFTVVRTGEWVPVFVYGTMLRWERNHARLEGRHARFIGEAKTENASFQMHNKTTSQGYNAPAALYGPEYRCRVYGELYHVESSFLIELDMYEGHPDVYKRRKIAVECREGTREPAWMYLHTNPEKVKTWEMITVKSYPTGLFQQWRSR